MAAFDVAPASDSDPRIARIWTELAGAARAPFFLFWDTMATWLASLPPDHGVQLVVGEQSGQPVLACLLGQRRFARHRVFRGVALTLNATGNPRADHLYIEHNDVLVHPDVEATPLIHQLLDWLGEQWPEAWDELHLPGVCQDAKIYAALQEMPRADLDLETDRDQGSPYIDLECIRRADGEFDASVSANCRQQIRRAKRAYEAEGSLALVVAPDVETSLTIFDELVGLHQSSWQGRDEPGAFADPLVVQFHRALISRCVPVGSIQLLALRNGERTIGCLYEFVDDHTVWFYQSGFAYESDNKKRPGLLTHYLAIHHYLDRGQHIYDFLAGESRYKQSLASHSRSMRWLRLQRPRLTADLESGLKAIKRRLG